VRRGRQGVETKPRSKHHVTGTNGTSPDRRAGRGDWRPGPWHGARRGAESNEVLAVGQLLEAIADPTNLVTAWAKIRANAGAAGVDDQSIAAFAADEDHQLVSLRRRLLSAERYVSPPVRRVEIPKPDGRRRPLGIPTVADRVVQQATVQVIARLSRPGSCAVRDGFEFLGFSFHGRFLRPRARALIRFKDEVRRRTRPAGAGSGSRDDRRARPRHPGLGPLLQGGRRHVAVRGSRQVDSYASSLQGDPSTRHATVQRQDAQQRPASAGACEPSTISVVPTCHLPLARSRVSSWVSRMR
jgi:hypothetical protein